MTKFAKSAQYGLLLEAEVPLESQARFEKRYKPTTGGAVSPGNPNYYQSQSNKWGAELRVYFDDPGMAASLEALGVHVEYPRKGYRSGGFDIASMTTNSGGSW